MNNKLKQAIEKEGKNIIKTREEYFKEVEIMFNYIFEANNKYIIGDKNDTIEFEEIEGALHVFPNGKQGHSLKGCCCNPMQYFKHNYKKTLIIHI